VLPQAALVRLAVVGPDVAVDPRRWPGRSAYVCPSPDCLERALARKVLPRALRLPPGRLEAAALRAGVAGVAARRAAAGIGATAGYSDARGRAVRGATGPAGGL
jgi:hypothetical protein